MMSFIFGSFVMSDLIVFDDALDMREQIEQFEDFLLQQPQIDISEFEIENIFCDGIYIKKAVIPRDTLLTGALHLTEHINIIISGKIRVLTEQSVETITAPYIFISKPMVKRVGYAIQDTIWLNVHSNRDNLNLDALSLLLTVRTHKEAEKWLQS